jgi:hypothetical protein
VNDSTTNRVTSLLAAYWLRNPAACDTPEGIHRWWMNGRPDVSVGNVEEALIAMIGKGLVERRVTGERSIYRLRAGADRDALEALA